MATDDTLPGQRLLTALFDGPASADRAVEALVGLGIGRDRIAVTEGALSAEPGHGSFFEAVWEMFLPEGDRESYAEGLSRGARLVSVWVDDAQCSRALDILDREGSMDLDEHESIWRSEGWLGFTPGQVGSGAIGAAQSTTTGVAAEVPLGSTPIVEPEAARSRAGRLRLEERRPRVRLYRVDPEA